MAQFITPVQGKLTQPFKGAAHEGIDIGAPDHSPVFASESGTVTLAGIWGLGGNTIIIKGNDGWTTIYCHLAQFLVNKGTTVVQGQEIALSGGALGEAGAGNASGPHLHFEIHNPSGQAIDPLTMISLSTSEQTIADQTSGGANSLYGFTLPDNSSIPGADLLKNLRSNFDAANHDVGNVAGAGKALLSWPEYLAKVGSFLTTKDNWIRIGEFAAGVLIMIFVLKKTLEHSEAVQSSLSNVKEAAKLAPLAA